MRLAMQAAPQASDLHAPRWDTALVGTAVDDRGRAAVAYATEQADRVRVLTYDPDTLDISLDGGVLSLAELDAEVGACSLLLEATTLGFVEIFLASRLRRERAQGGLALVYAEPADYRNPPRPSAMHRRDFELSDEVRNFAGVPGATFLLEDDVRTRVAFLVGYEGQRLEQAFEQNAIRPSDAGVIFGVPAFQPGWEMNSFANNIRVIRERRIPTVLYAGAQNPSSAMRALREFRRAAPDTRLLIGAIGTKPHGIAAALFACEDPDVGLIYDHPTRQHGRSSQVATWHLFAVHFDAPG